MQKWMPMGLVFFNLSQPVTAGSVYLLSSHNNVSVRTLRVSIHHLPREVNRRKSMKSFSSTSRRYRLLLLAVCYCTLALSVQEGNPAWQVDFPTSGSEKDRRTSCAGALHSFGTKRTPQSFRESTKASRFHDGVLGEAMSYNIHFGKDQQQTAAREMCLRSTNLKEIDKARGAYLNAVKVLYGEGDKATRDKAYSVAMEKNLSRLIRRSGGGLLLCAVIAGSCAAYERGFLRR